MKKKSNSKRGFKSKSKANFNNQLNLGIKYFQSGKLSEAKACLQKVLETQPENSRVWHTLGLIEAQNKQYSTAIKHIQRAIALNPEEYLFHYNLGLTYQSQREFNQAIASYQKSLQIKPQHYQSQYNLGVLYQNQGKLAEAIDCYQKSIHLQPNHGDAYYNLGVIHHQQGKLAAAIPFYQKAIEIKPNYAAAYYNLGIIFKQQNKLAAAIDSYQKSLQFQPHNPDAYNNLGNIFKDQRKFTEAINCYHKALQLKPDYADAYHNLGVAFKEQGNLAQAIASYEKAIQLKPNYPEAYNNLGNAWKGQGKLKKAIASYQKAIQLKPDHSDAHFHLSTAFLLTENFEQGWQEYQWRFSKTEPIKKPLSSPMWQGQSLSDNHLLLWSEQGLGDTIQFVRYALLLSQQGFKITIATHFLLLRLFQECLTSSVKVINQDKDDLSLYNNHISLMSLPRVLKTTLNNIPTAIPYLKSPENIPESLKLPKSPRLKIGIVWASNKSNRQLYEQKSIPVELFFQVYDELLESDQISLWSLQVGEDASQIQPWLNNNLIHNVSPLLKNFVDTVCVIEQLDLVITVDTAVAHLAGAMGKPVWVLLPFIPDWRWLLNRQDSPWYPSMKLFRQPRAGDWQTVLHQLKQEIYTQCSSFKPSVKAKSNPTKVIDSFKSLFPM